MNYSIIDMETDGLLDTVTKIHCISVYEVIDGVEYSYPITEYDQMKRCIESRETIIGHNVIKFDNEVWKKFGINFKGRLIDSLGLSWYLYPNRYEHGLESWGKDLGVAKPIIEDWTSLEDIDYIHRCEEDVKINKLLWDLQASYLFNLYEGDTNNALRLIGYLSFKLVCAAEQEEVKWRCDIDKAKANIEKLTLEREKRKQILIDVMPQMIEYKLVARPKTLYKKDGDLSIAGEKWLNLLKELDLPDYHMGTLKLEKERFPGNPNSHQQLKDWLFSLGWIPDEFKITKNKAGEIGRVPQISKTDNSGDICDSIVTLYDKEPKLANIEGYFIISHRIGILEGFIDNIDKDGFLKAEIGGFTNTLRFQHKKPLVNLPTLYKAYGEEVRGCLIAPSDEYVLCGADIAGLEDSTKHHYMWPYDPEYVKEMRQPGYDPHIDIGVLAGVISKEDGHFYKWIKTKKQLFGDLVPEAYKALLEPSIKDKILDIAKIRDKAKKSNFAAVYGAGPAKIALTANIELGESKLFHGTYHKRNWSLKKITNNIKWKTMPNGSMWLWNPVAELWYNLKAEKDKFSTLNQGTGAYCADMWIREVRRSGIKICGQFHDEIIFPTNKETTLEAKKAVEDAMVRANQELKLNIQLGVSVQFGDNYAAIH